MPLRPLLENIRVRLLDTLLPKRKALRELRARWGKPGTKDNWYASEYFDLVRDVDSTAWVDDKTWVDLELPQIFASMDVTVTPVGSQVLFRKLREYVSDPDRLAKQYAIYAELQSDVVLREKLQRKLLPLKDEANARIADFIFGELPPPLRHRSLLQGWALASLGVLVAVAAWSWLIWIWLAMVVVNAVIIFLVGGRVSRDVETLKACLQLVKVANDLAAMHKNCPSLPQLAGLRDAGKDRARLRRALWWLSFLKLPLVLLVATWLNFAFLVELLVHVRAMQRFASLRHKLAASFGLVGEIDAAIAIASWLAYRPDHCPPTMTNRPVLEIRDGQHPLLTDGVGNSIRLDGRSILVTGSNMAGKTTFIKMLGVNAVLGQTLGFCLASAAVIPRAPVMASIQAGHSVASGKSHYFSEIETIHSFLARQTRGGCTIFVIDELFSGTNTVERVAIARAVLEALSRHSLVLATTHDVELQAFLQDHYDLCHFQESPEVDGFFDYKPRSGPATERNAIRLLGELGFPDEIIANAMTYAAQELDSRVRDDERGSRNHSEQPVNSD